MIKQRPLDSRGRQERLLERVSENFMEALQMRYIEVKIYTAPEEIDPLTRILTEMGIAGFAVEDIRDIQELLSKKNAYDWDYIDERLINAKNIRTNVTLYLDDSDEGCNTLNQIRQKIANAGIGEYELVYKTVDDSEWKDKWKEYFKPTRITDRIVIKPTWEEYAPAHGELVIEIDPGMASEPALIPQQPYVSNF
jgi:ribosomal protein L11 methyltransferase